MDAKAPMKDFLEWIEREKDTYEKYVIIFFNTGTYDDDCTSYVCNVGFCTAYQYVKDILTRYLKYNPTELAKYAKYLFKELHKLHVCMYKVNGSTYEKIYPIGNLDCIDGYDSSRMDDDNMKYYMEKIRTLRGEVKFLCKPFAYEQDEIRQNSRKLINNINLAIRDINETKESPQKAKDFIEYLQSCITKYKPEG